MGYKTLGQSWKLYEHVQLNVPLYTYQASPKAHNLTHHKPKIILKVKEIKLGYKNIANIAFILTVLLLK